MTEARVHRVTGLLRVAIVDDEELARLRLRRFVTREADVDLVGEAESGTVALDLIRRESPDVVLLDVQMPDMDGFAVMAKLGADFAGQVIFVTAFDAHAVKAFEVNAVDYLLKPVAAGRLHAALERAREVIAHRAVAQRFAEVLAVVQKPVSAPPAVPDVAIAAAELAEGVGHGPTERFLVKTNDRALLIKVEDVDWFEAEANYVRLHVGAHRHLIRATMSSLEASLDESRFVRIHRTTIVNLDRVKEIRAWFSGDHVVVLADGTKLRMSRSYAPRLMSRVRAG